VRALDRNREDSGHGTAAVCILGGMAEGAHVDELLGNAAWVRRLALRMLADRDLAEDVAQETWIAGLRAGPSGSELRPWLARVVKNFALQKLRSERARGSRERAVARPEPSPSSSETVERAELHALLVQAVLALDEPYRTTILWRYFTSRSSATTRSRGARRSTSRRCAAAWRARGRGCATS
jgi:RNA polymerase sigma factor (sigma-70 family)